MTEPLLPEDIANILLGVTVGEMKIRLPGEVRGITADTRLMDALTISLDVTMGAQYSPVPRLVAELQKIRDGDFDQDGNHIALVHLFKEFSALADKSMDAE